MKLALANKQLERKAFWLEKIRDFQKRLEVCNENVSMFKNHSFWNLEKQCKKDVKQAEELIEFCRNRFNNINIEKL